LNYATVNLVPWTGLEPAWSRNRKPALIQFSYQGVKSLKFLPAVDDFDAPVGAAPTHDGFADRRVPVSPRRGPPSQGWRTFLHNHAPDIAAMDLFVVPTIGFDLLYAILIVRLDRRELIWINVTANPTADWVARQLTEAFPWDEAPRHLIRDRDRVYGSVVTRRLRAVGFRDKPTAPASPWQNGFAERLIGSIRRECVDHIIVLGEVHLRQIMQSYARYCNDIRTHRSLDKDAPFSRQIQRIGSIKSHTILGGLHHHYARA
jgi:transposase InsO family protein